MHKKNCLPVLLAGLILSAIIMPARAEQAKKPNVLLIFVDDLGVHDLSPFTGQDMPTPSLQAFSGNAVKFTRFYGDSTCQPARTALLSGLPAPHLGMRPTGRGIPLQVDTLADRLKQQGYWTAHVGKWHLDWQNKKAWPGSQGFDYWFGFLSQWLLQGPGPGGQMVSQWPPTYHDPWLQKNGGPMKQYKGQLTDILSKRVKQMIQHPGGFPWFIDYWMYAPHTPYQPDNKYAKRFSKSTAGRYKALVAQMDSKIGMLIKTLKKTGQYKNTLIIFASDNGGPNRARDNNFPYSGEKDTYTEGGLRVPMMIHWPGGAGAGRVTDAVVNIRDLTATAVAVGGASTRGIQGHDLTPFAHGRKYGWPRTLYWENDFAPLGLVFGVLSKRGRWRLRWNGRRIYLYDLKKTPAGSRNVADSHQDIARKLIDRWRQWHNKMRVVDAKYTERDHGAVVKGDGMLRTPGRRGYTFGIGIHPESGSQSVQVIAQQPHVWKLTRKGRNIELHFRQGDWHGKLPANAEKRACIPVVWTGLFQNANDLENNDKARAALYIDGKKMDGSKFPYPDVREYLHAPTWIGRNSQGKKRFRGQLGKPVFLVDYLYSRQHLGHPGAAEFSSSICEGGLVHG